jgi:hypothetical protein
MGVPTPTGVLQGAAAFSWDGSAWQPSNRAGPGVGTPTGVLLGVAPFSWSGSAWQPSGRAGPGVPTPSGTLEGIALYTWNGSAWVPSGGGPGAPTPTGTLRGVAGFTWDGTAWQPAGQAGPDVATPSGVLTGMAMFSWSGTGWTTAPALDLVFSGPPLDPRLTFTRASTATFFDVAGVMQTAAINTPRWDFDPVSHALRGMLMEDARTNLLLNSATLGTQSVAVTAQSYVLSFYGTGTITLSGAATGPLVGTGAFPQRVFSIFTPAAGTLTCTVTGSVLNAQLEAGNGISSYIPTTAAAVTRGNDSCSVPTGSWFNPSASTIAAEYFLPVGSSPTIVGGTSDGTFGNSFYFSPGAATYAGSGGGSANANAAQVLGAVNKSSACFTPALLRSCLNNTVPGSLVMTAAPLIATRISIGCDPWSLSNDVFGHVRRIRYWPRSLSDAEMQAVTT